MAQKKRDAWRRVTEDLLERVDVVCAVVGREVMPASRILMCAASRVVRTWSRLRRVWSGAGRAGRRCRRIRRRRLRVQQQDGAEVGDRVLGGGAAGALVVHLVVITVCIEVALQRIRIRLAGLQSIAGGDAVAEADENGRSAAALVK